MVSSRHINSETNTHLCLHTDMSLSCTSNRYDSEFHKWGKLNMLVGRPDGAIAFLVLRIL